MAACGQRQSAKSGSEKHQRKRQAKAIIRAARGISALASATHINIISKQRIISHSMYIAAARAASARWQHSKISVAAKRNIGIRHQHHQWQAARNNHHQ